MSSSNLTPKQTLGFLSVPEPTSDASQNYNFDPKVDSTTALVLPHFFLSPSVNGFIQSHSSPSAPKVLTQDVVADAVKSHQKSESPWKSSLPGSLSVLEWR